MLVEDTQTHICCSFVQFPISAGIEPENLFELIPLHAEKCIKDRWKHQNLTFVTFFFFLKKRKRMKKKLTAISIL